MPFFIFNTLSKFFNNSGLWVLKIIVLSSIFKIWFVIFRELLLSNELVISSRTKIGEFLYGNVRYQFSVFDQIILNHPHPPLTKLALEFFYKIITTWIFKTFVENLFIVFIKISKCYIFQKGIIKNIYIWYIRNRSLKFVFVFLILFKNIFP